MVWTGATRKASSSAYGSEAIRTVLVAPSKSSGINAARQDGSYRRTIAPLFSMRSALSSAGCEGWRNGCAEPYLPLDRSRRQLAITLLNRWPQAQRRRELQRRFHRWAAFLSKARARETQTRHDARQAELAQLALRLLIRWAQASIRRRLLNLFARWTDFLANARARERETRRTREKGS